MTEHAYYYFCVDSMTERAYYLVDGTTARAYYFCVDGMTEHAYYF